MIAISQQNFDKSYLQKKSRILITIFFAATLYFGNQVFNTSTESYFIIYLTVILLSISTTLFILEVTNLLFKESEFKIKFASLIANLFFAVSYGPKIFINYYSYDDWVWLKYKYEVFNFEYLTTAINYHYIPFFKLYFYPISLFSPNYFAFSFSLFFISQLLIITIGIFLKTNNISQRQILFVLILFAIWPTFQMSRTWYAGGFWLALPIPFFLILLIYSKEFLEKNIFSFKYFLGIFILSSITVLSSSQILLPGTLLLSYLIPIVLCTSSNRKLLLYKVIAIVLATLPSTIVALLNRPNITDSNINISGLLDGRFIKNLNIFIHEIVFFDKLNEYIFSAYLLFAVILNCIIFKKINRNIILNKYRIPLLCLGVTIILLWVLQIGLARSWEPYIVRTPYYLTFPLMGAFFCLTSLLGFFQSKDLRTLKINPYYFEKTQVLLGFCMIAYMLTITVSIYFPTKNYIDSTYQRRQFVDDLTRGVCEELSFSSAESVYFYQYLPFSFCPNCTNLMGGPTIFLDSLDSTIEIKDARFFQFFSKIIAENACPDQAHRITFDYNALNVEYTSGVRPGTKMEHFYKTYFKAMH